MQTDTGARGSACARVMKTGFSLVKGRGEGETIRAKEVAGVAKIGRPMGTKKYTAAAFSRGCKAYFASISYQRPVTRPEMILDDDGCPVLDDYGHTRYKQVPIITADGKEAWETCWIEPPSIQALCLHLGIDASTFSRYQKPDPEDPDGEKLAEAARLAKARVEAYLISRLEDKGAANGTKFNLQHNFGWMEKKQEDSNSGAGSSKIEEQLTGKTMAEKLQMLQEAGVDMSLWE